MTRDPRPILEDATQAATVDFLSYAAHPKLLWYHCPNGALVKASARIYFSKLGVFPGVADLPLVLPDRTAAFLEFKTATGRQTLDQMAFQQRCEALGLPYAIARSFDEAREILLGWGALRGAGRRAAA